MVHPHDGIFLSLIKEGSSGTGYGVDGPEDVVSSLPAGALPCPHPVPTQGTQPCLGTSAPMPGLAFPDQGAHREGVTGHWLPNIHN